MSDEARDRFEIPKGMRQMAEAGVDQARKAFEKFMANAQATAGTIEERRATVRAGAGEIGAREIGTKAVTYSEKLGMEPRARPLKAIWLLCGIAPKSTLRCTKLT